MEERREMPHMREDLNARKAATRPVRGPRRLVAPDGSPIPMLDEAFGTPSKSNVAQAYLARLASDWGCYTSRRALDHVAIMATGGRLDAQAFPWEMVRAKDVSKIVVALQALGYTQATISGYLTVLRGVLVEAAAQGLLGWDDLERIRLVKVHRNHPDLPTRVPRILTREQVTKLFSLIPSTPLGIRNRAIMACLYPGGMKTSEVVRLDLSDYDTTTGRMRIRNVREMQPAIQLFDNGAATALERWCDVRGDEPGPLFLPFSPHRHPTVYHRRMDKGNVNMVVLKLSKAAGMPKLSSKDLRHTVATHLDEAGCSLGLIQAHLRHRYLVSTMGCIHRQRDLRMASTLLTIPGS